MKNLVKTLNKNDAVFKCLEYKFPHISVSSLKAGIFIDPLILELRKDKHFEEALDVAEVNTRFSIKQIVQHFF